MQIMYLFNRNQLPNSNIWEYFYKEEKWTKV